MPNTIKLKNSGTISAVPSSLEYGELGLNYADGKLFYKNSSNSIVEFSSSGGISVSDATPSSPTIGDLWYESDTGKTFVYYDSFWVEISSGGGTQDGTSTLTTKGDILTRTSSTLERLGVGTNGYFLKANSSTSTGLEWGTASSVAGLDDLTDVTTPSPSSGDFLKYNGSAWVNDAIDLGTDTSGSYVSSLVAGTGVTLANNTGESSTPTISIGQAVGTTSNVTFNDLIVSGNITVNGNTTVINSTTLTVDDKNIELGSVTTPTNITADGGGITLKGATDKTLTWVNTTNAWTSSEDFNIVTGKVYEINGVTVLSSTQVLGKNLPSGDVVGTSDSQTLTNKTLTTPTIGTNATISGGTLVSTAATVLTPLSITANTGNGDNLLTKITRDSTGSDWTTSTWMIQRKVDATNMGFVEFGASSVTLGSNVTEVMTVTANEVIFNKPIVFEGTTADAFETSLTVVDPTADRTITLPNVTGTVVTSGDTGTVTSAMILDGTIANTDISNSAAIAHSKLANTTVGHVLLGTTTTGVITATAISGDITINGAGVVTIAANSVALGTDTTGNYVSSLVAGSGILITNNTGEGATPTVAVNTSVVSTKQAASNLQTYLICEV
jgi:hypothetical protein